MQHATRNEQCTRERSVVVNTRHARKKKYTQHQQESLAAVLSRFDGHAYNGSCMPPFTCPAAPGTWPSSHDRSAPPVSRPKPKRHGFTTTSPRGRRCCSSSCCSCSCFCFCFCLCFCCCCCSSFFCCCCCCWWCCCWCCWCSASSGGTPPSELLAFWDRACQAAPSRPQGRQGRRNAGSRVDRQGHAQVQGIAQVHAGSWTFLSMGKSSQMFPPRRPKEKAVAVARGPTYARELGRLHCAWDVCEDGKRGRREHPALAAVPCTTRSM